MRGRRIGVAALLVAGTILWTVGSLAVWVKRQAIDTDNWVDTSSEMLESEPIRTALGVYIVNELFTSADVEDRLEEVLPPNLDRLAGPASAALKQVAIREAPDILGSAVALDAWRKANEVAHGEFIEIVEGKLEGSPVSINLGELVNQVAESAGLPEGVAERLPPQVANLTIAKPDELETIQNVFDIFETLVWVFVLLAVASFAGALALSQDRRRTTITVGGCLILSAFLIFAIRRLGERWVLDTLAESPNAAPAADDAWRISTSLLGEVAQGSLLFGLFVVLGAWLAGAGRRATCGAALLCSHVARAPRVGVRGPRCRDPAARDLGPGAMDAADRDHADLHGPRLRLARVDAAARARRVPRRARAAIVPEAPPGLPGGRLTGEDLRLLGLELRVGEDALCLQVAEVLELLHPVRSRGRRCGRGRGGGSL